MKKKTNTPANKIILIAVLAISSCFTVNAQVNVSFNLGLQPAWGPTGYDHVDYYYIPDANAYYDVNRRAYIYQEGRVWRTHSSLPVRYRNVDLYHAHKVVINERDPWMRHENYRRQYGSFAGRRDQEAIRDARDQKYWQNPGHPQYNKWRKEHGNDNRRNDDRGHGNDNRGRDNGNHGHGNDNRGHGNGRGH